MNTLDPGRRQHYGDFYGGDYRRRDDSLPFVTVMGNCQAESLRILLDSSGAVESFRIPPVHEFTAEDIDLLTPVLAHTDVLITQPIHDSYRDLPLGTSELSALLPEGARTITYPVLRYDGLFPYQAIIRDPADPSRNPPVVPYHDLRILVAAARGLTRPVEAAPDDEALRTTAAMSVEQLRTRERHHGTVVISDVLETAPVWHTMNHPSNATLAALAQRVLDDIVPDGTVHAPTDREMLGGLAAPVDPQAARALGVDVTGRDTWLKNHEPVDHDEIIDAQLAFYREHPQIIDAGLTRHAERLSVLGLA